METAARNGSNCEGAATLWPLLRKRAAKRKTLTYAEVAEALAMPQSDALATAWPLHVWCWLRGMPPLNVLLVPRGKTPLPEGGFPTTEFDVFHEALGRSVYTTEDAWFYPWEKVPDPEPDELAWALRIHASHSADVRAFRFLDLEADLRHRDEARGRRRPVPPPHATWNELESARSAALASLEAADLRLRDLRPPGTAPYPPPRPVIGNWAD